MLSPTARYDLAIEDGALRISASGHWTVRTVAALDTKLNEDVRALEYDAVMFDLSGIDDLDTAGAYILTRAIRVGASARRWRMTGGRAGYETLLNVAAQSQLGDPPVEGRQWVETLERVGEATVRFWDETIETLAFVGQFFVMFWGVLIGAFLNLIARLTGKGEGRKTKLRMTSIVALMEEVGLDAAPIVAALSFAIGAVIAYMGANLLAQLGFSVFMVDLVGFAMLRELAVVITAILIAGRSASAFTAQIGAMKMRQEIDAMTVMGLDTFETLVVPRAIACLLTIPILTFLAMMSGLFGGLIVAWVVPVDISPTLFIARLREMVGIDQFIVGMVKAPFFAVVIAIIGCRQGMAVGGSVDSLGSRVTTAVVQAIFAVIFIDALFAILFFQLGV